jgi:hypothetical protein
MHNFMLIRIELKTLENSHFLDPKSSRTYKRSTANMFLNLLTFGLWGKLGKVAHYAFDAVLISTILAGMKRSTGLTPSFKKEAVSENKDINIWIEKYLAVGEFVLDQSVAIAGASNWFERKR